MTLSVFLKTILSKNVSECFTKVFSIIGECYYKENVAIQNTVNVLNCLKILLILKIQKLHLTVQPGQLYICSFTDFGSDLQLGQGFLVVSLLRRKELTEKTLKHRFSLISSASSRINNLMFFICSVFELSLREGVLNCIAMRSVI